jgi:NAD+ synthetase
MKTALGAFAGLPDENLQSRLRGLTAMAVSNADGSLVLSTGNKSELAVGYATLYGDMVGGMAPIGDVLMMQVYAMARHLNAHFADFGLRCAPIPEPSITKAPSADLWPGQTDEGEGGFDYPTLDRILFRLVDQKKAASAVVADGFDAELVAKVQGMMARSQFKREMPPFPKISA